MRTAFLTLSLLILLQSTRRADCKLDRVTAHRNKDGSLVARFVRRQEQITLHGPVVVPPTKQALQPSAACLKLFIPQQYLERFQTLSTAECWRTAGQLNMVLELFNLGIFIAGTSAGIPVVDSIDPLDGCTYFVRDHLYDEALEVLPARAPPGYADQWLWEIRGNSLHASKPHRRMVRLGLPVINYRWGVEEAWNAEMQEAMLSLNDPSIVTLYLGMPQQFTFNKFKSERRLLVDEMYHTTPLDAKLQRVLDQSFNATMAVAKILHERFGWQISSYAGRWAGSDMAKWQRLYPFVSVTNLNQTSAAGGPLGKRQFGNRKEYLQLIRSNTFYHSHMWETYGMPFYEMLQHGIPVFSWAELVPPLLFQHHKNSVICSLLDEAEQCARSIEGFYCRRWSAALYEEIRATSNTLYAAETFGMRLQQAFAARQGAST